MKSCLNKLSLLLPAIYLTVSPSSIASEIDDLMSMDFDQLSSQSVTVTTAAKKAQSLEDVPASVYVITNEQIRRSGVRSIAEALALAPGVQVTKISEFNWQVSLRGLNETLFNKLLVMVDGYSVFSPLMSGTFWHTIDTVLNDIDRIEILRGSAGTMWGGNATNGVINIITKNSNETLGNFFEIGSGEFGYKEANYRSGFQINNFTTAKLAIKGTQSNYYTFNDDEWNNYNVTFRTDYEKDNEFLSWYINGYHAKSQHHSWYQYKLLEKPLNPFDPLSAVLAYSVGLEDYSRGVYSHLNMGKMINDTQYKLSLWGSSNSRTEPTAQGQYDTLNGDALMIKPLNDDHELSVGAGARYTTLTIPQRSDDFYNHILPYQRTADNHKQYESIFNAFGQMESQWSDKITSTLGVKVEHFTRNNSTEVQPQLRVLYKASDKHQWWSGVGRAVVTPSAVDSSSNISGFSSVLAPFIDAPIPECAVFDCYAYYPMLALTSGNPDMDNESVVTWDAGYRGQITDDFSIDATVFYSEYDNLRMLDNGTWLCKYGVCTDGSTQPGQIAIHEYNYVDALEAQSYGAELAFNWQPMDTLSIYGSYSFIDTQANCSSAYSTCISSDMGGYKGLYNNQPKHYGSLQMLWTINPQWQIDGWVKHKGAVSSNNDFYHATDITTMDLRVAWQHKHTWPMVEFIVDGLGSSTYQDMPNKALLEESVFMRLSWTKL